LWLCTCHPSYGGKPKIGGWKYRLAWAKMRPYLQNYQSKKRSEEFMPNKHEALTSNHSTAGKKKKKQEG
jgi:hypothetical protein